MTHTDLSLVGLGDIARALPLSRYIELARDAYRATATDQALNSTLGHVAAPDGDFLIKASGLAVGDRLFAAVKVVAFFEQRPRSMGLPSIVGLIQLFDATNGQPLAVMDAALITKLRTAAGTAVALDELARADASRLLVCGAGTQALPHVQAVAAVRDLDAVQLWARSPERAQTTLADIRTQLPEVRTQIVNDLGAAVSDADLIICLTPATKPILRTADVRPGTTIAAVGSDTPDKQELPIDLLACAALVCDVTDQCANVGELHHALDASAMTLADVRAEIGQVIAGTRPGRQRDDEILIFDSTGTAVQDVGPAAAAYLAATEASRVDLWAD